MNRRDDIERLWKARPRNRFARVSLFVFLALLLGSWVFLKPRLPDIVGREGLTRLERFWQEDVRPAPVRGSAWDGDAVAAWAGALWNERGAEAVIVTLGISVLAIVIAWFASLLLSVPAARTIATPEPFLPSGHPPTRFARLAWRSVVVGTRALLILMRSLPEFVLAYILIQMFGYSAWPAVLALAIHNAGILGRLNAEVIENLPPRALRALRSTGASRAEILTTGVFPAALNRFLLYFFYRWETCVREATVLGMLGIVSLGYWIEDARHAGQEDVLVFYVLLGSALVLAGDFISAGARALVRRA